MPKAGAKVASSGMRSLLPLLPYFNRYKGRIALGVLFIVLTSLFSVYTRRWCAWPST